MAHGNLQFIIELCPVPEIRCGDVIWVQNDNDKMEVARVRPSHAYGEVVFYRQDGSEVTFRETDKVPRLISDVTP